MHPQKKPLQNRGVPEHFLAGTDLENNLNPLAFQVYTKDMFPLLRGGAGGEDRLKW